MKLIIIFIIGLVLLCLNLSVVYINFFQKKSLRIILSISSLLIINAIIYLGLKVVNVLDLTFFIYIAVLPFIASLVFLFSNKEKPSQEEKKKKIVLEHEKGRIEYNNPFNGFLGYGGAESGKTASIGKPLLKQYMLNHFAGFVYDAKENDYTLTALQIKEEINYPYPIYNLDFLDVNRSYRTNIFCPQVITEPLLVPEFSELFFVSFLKEGERQNEWFDMALGTFKAVAWIFYNYFPEYCSLPHICNFIVHTEPDNLLKLVSQDDTAKSYAGALINSQGSERTFSSILTTLSKYISDFAGNRNACYILSGDDFLYNPLDPENPKMICVSNHFRARNIISPLVVLLFTTIAKQIKFGNQIPIVFFLDEATTFKIPDLEAYPSELREYLVAFVMLTQSAGKIEKKYNKYDRSSLESNLANQFYGWTADILALQTYSQQFSKADEKMRSITTGDNRSTSTTTSIRKEVRYDGEFFGNLKPGEFVGKCKNANVKTFHTRFKPYTGGKKEELPKLREISSQDIEQYYQNLIQDVKAIKFNS